MGVDSWERRGEGCIREGIQGYRDTEIQGYRDTEMAYQLRTWTILAKDQSLVPNTYIKGLTILESSKYFFTDHYIHVHISTHRNTRKHK